MTVKDTVSKIKYKPQTGRKYCTNVEDKCMIDKIKTNNLIEQKKKIRIRDVRKDKPKWKWTYEKTLSLTCNQAMQINIDIKYHVIPIRCSKVKSMKSSNIHKVDKQWVLLHSY